MQDNTLELVGKLVGYAQKGNTYLMEYQPLENESDDGNLSVLVPSSKVTELFPAGIPAIGDNFMITFTKDAQGAQLVSSFNLDSEVIPASDIPEFDVLEQYNTKGQNAMQLAELKAAREKEYEEIANDQSLQEELAQIRKEEAEERAAMIKKNLERTGIEAYFDDDVDFSTPQQASQNEPQNNNQSGIQSHVAGD